MKLFVGNLSWNATEEALKEIFEEFGEVVSIRIVTDPYTGRSKGFGFVEYSAEDAGSKAIEKLDNFQFMGRPLRVSRARTEERTGGGAGPRGPRGSGSGPRSGGGMRGGNGGGGSRPMRSPRFEESQYN